MATPQREKAWLDFRSWCVARGLRALPAHPWTVAAYVRFCQSRHRPKTIAGKLETIVRAHVFKGHASPEKNIIVKRTLRLAASDVAALSRKRRSLFAEEGLSGPTEKAATKGKPRLRQKPRLVSRKRP